MPIQDLVMRRFSLDVDWQTYQRDIHPLGDINIPLILLKRYSCHIPIDHLGLYDQFVFVINADIFARRALIVFFSSEFGADRKCHVFTSQSIDEPNANKIPSWLFAAEHRGDWIIIILIWLLDHPESSIVVEIEQSGAECVV